MPDQLTGIYLLVTNPNVSVSPSPGQPAANTTAYYYLAEEGEDIAAVMNRAAVELGVNSANCQLIGFDEQYAVKSRLTVTLVPDES